jgi:excinuclease ABC subunit A
MGPGAGIHGGYIVAEGPPAAIEGSEASLTGQYLSRKQRIETPGTRRTSGRFITITGCRENNLKNIDVGIPIGVFTVVTGVSGSGKSTLIYDILYKALQKELHHSRVIPGDHDAVSFGTDIDKVIVIDQSPIGRTPRSESGDVYQGLR